jgi:RNA polymerase sigma-70 factor (ECF subfamily)
MNELALAPDQPSVARSVEREVARASMDDDPGSPAQSEHVSDVAARRFRGLVDAHFSFIWRSLRGLGVPAHSVDDAAQHVFWIASQKLDTVAVGSERAFLFGTARRVAANAHRCRARNREELDEETLDALVDENPNAEELVQMQEQRALLDRVLASMPEDLRTVFVLFVLEGLTTPEISELLGVASGTVASRLRRAREAFHTISKRLQAQVDDAGEAR